MCIAVPGKLIEMEDGIGRVDINGNILKVSLGAVNARLGDFVLVHAGCAISVLSKAEKDELDEILTLLSEMNYEERR